MASRAAERAASTTIVKGRFQRPHCGRLRGDHSAPSTNGIGWRWGKLGV